MFAYRFIAIKPDGVQVCAAEFWTGSMGTKKAGAKYTDREDSLVISSRGLRSGGKQSSGMNNYLQSSLLTAIERYKLVAMKLVTPSKEHLEKHYEDLSDKPFYKGLVTCTLDLEGYKIPTSGEGLIGLRYA